MANRGTTRVYRKLAVPFLIIVTTLVGGVCIHLPALADEPATGCCQCLQSCSDQFTDQESCIRYCLDNGDTWLNFYEGKPCSDYPACDRGACCGQQPECSVTTRLYCNAYWDGFLKGRPCSECTVKSIPSVSHWAIALGIAALAIISVGLLVKRRRAA